MNFAASSPIQPSKENDDYCTIFLVRAGGFLTSPVAKWRRACCFIEESSKWPRQTDDV